MMSMPWSIFFLLSLFSLAQYFHVSQAQNEPNDYLRPQNAARARVGVRPFVWDTTIENYAKRYAQVRSKDCALIHSKGPYGENIYWGQGTGVTDAAAAVRSWVDNERPFYDYNSNSCTNNKQCGHYTQVVWRNSLRIGCARSKCPGNNKYFITCNYDPPGNVVNQRPYEMSWLDL